jgi:hypothetical protein
VSLVVDDLVDDDLVLILILPQGREVLAGDLEAVEQEACAARVEVVGGDALQNLAKGELEGGAVVRPGEVEVAEAGLAGGGVFHRLAVGVVEVAEVLVAEARAAAAATSGEDVTALKAVVVLVVVAAVTAGI